MKKDNWWKTTSQKGKQRPEKNWSKIIQLLGTDRAKCQNLGNPYYLDGKKINPHSLN